MSKVIMMTMMVIKFVDEGLLTILIVTMMMMMIMAAMITCISIIQRSLVFFGLRMKRKMGRYLMNTTCSSLYLPPKWCKSGHHQGASK